MHQRLGYRQRLSSANIVEIRVATPEQLPQRVGTSAAVPHEDQHVIPAGSPNGGTLGSSSQMLLGEPSGVNQSAAILLFVEPEPRPEPQHRNHSDRLHDQKQRERAIELR